MNNIFVKTNYHLSGGKLLKALLQIRPYQCECCKNTEWLGKKIKLEVHHIDGDNTNNELENLKLLCPNCHSFTDTWKKTKIKKQITDEELIEALKTSQTIHQALIKVNLSTSGANYTRAKTLILKNNISLLEPTEEEYLNKIKKYYCIDCGKELITNAMRCKECANIAQRKIERPSREELKQLIRNKSFLEITRIYNNQITDNGIRKWCNYYNLPRRKKDINSYSDEEWKLI